MRVPDYTGRSSVNLVAHLERMRTGTSPTNGLAPDLAADVPDGESTVLVLIDGLGHDMVAALPDDSPLRMALRASMDASFSTQTSVATATLATGLPPAQHGLIGYLLDIPEAGGIVNTLWWMRTDGSDMEVDLDSFLPAPNVAERLAEHDIEAVAVEPAGYLGTPLDRVLYRGARTRGVADTDEFVDVIVEEAGTETFVLAYLPHVDAAGHLEGPGSGAHRDAIAEVERTWAALSTALPDQVTLVGTADHGMVAATDWIEVEAPDGVRIGGDSRTLFLYGDQAACAEFAAGLPGNTVAAFDALDLWGPEPRHPAFMDRLPRFLHFAPDATVFHHLGNPMRLAGYHGGITAAELEIPLLVR